MPALDLATLDDIQPIDLDPAIWAANQAALRLVNAAMARALDDCPWPAGWRAARGLDGAITFRVESPEQPAKWLADTAAPLARARAVLPAAFPQDKNPALSNLAAATELEWLLARLFPHQALYAFEDDLRRLAAALRAHDFSTAIHAGRLIFVSARDEIAFLTDHLTRNTGLLPPGTLLSLPGTPPERILHLRGVCEKIAAEVGRARGARMSALRAQATSASPEPRPAFVGLAPNLLVQRLARELTDAARSLNWSAEPCVLDTPAAAHLLPHVERLCEFRPSFVLGIDQDPPAALPAARRLWWHWSVRELPESLPNDATVHLAATPRVASALTAAGAAPVDFFWATRASPPQPAPRSATTPSSSNFFALVGDLPDPRPETCGIVHPTHLQLWAQLRGTAEKLWESREIDYPQAVLSAAERASGVVLGEAALRKQMLRLVEHVLIPAVVLERIWGTLESEGLAVKVIGRGWSRLASGRTLADDAWLLDDTLIDAPLAAVFAAPSDPLHPALLLTADRGWPLLIHAPVSRSAALGQALQAQQHYETFAGAKELKKQLAAARVARDAFAKRAQRAAAHVRANHTLAHRLATLAQRLSAEAAL